MQIGYQKTLEDIFKNSKYIIADEVNFSEDDLKLIDDKAKKIINEFNNEIKLLDNFNRDNLEKILAAINTKKVEGLYKNSTIVFISKPRRSIRP